jgi:hypothetical protein
LKENAVRLHEPYNLSKQGKGLVSLFSFDEKTRRICRQISLQNLILYSGADILGRLLAGQSAYAINMVYLEFKNTGAAITPPAVSRADGIAYYNGLSGSMDTDFLRLPLLVEPSVDASGADYESNQATFFAESEGTEGFFSKPFSETASSFVFGAALVAAPDPTDQSKDIVFSRVYIGELGWTDAIDKQDGKQVGLTWAVRFK